MSEMTAEQREAMLKRADAFGTAPDHWREILHALTERGFVVTHPDIRDHTDCETCKGRGVQYREQRTPAVVTRVGEHRRLGTAGSRVATRPCPGGVPVPWEASE